MVWHSNHTQLKSKRTQAPLPTYNGDSDGYLECLYLDVVTIIHALDTSKLVLL